jgi:hypothetical protein
MSRTKRLAVSVTTAAALAALLSTSAFAESRNQNGTWRNNRDDRGSRQSSRNDDNRRYRDNERVTVQGRVQSFRQERDGYRLNLDRDRYSYWVPSSHFRNRSRGLRVGINISLGGVFRGGSIYVDNVGWPDDGYYGDRRYNDGYRDNYVRGVVERVDLRRGTLILRDDSSGCYITVDMRRDDRRWDRSIDLNDLRRGDYVSLSGDWSRGVFTAYRIESVRSGRRY